jgi:hypothetical protein
VCVTTLDTTRALRSRKRLLLEGNTMYEITVKKAGSIYELRVSSKRAVSKPRYFKSAELAITEANSLAGFYNNATVTLEV